MLGLHNYPTDTMVRIGDRVFRKVTPGSFWREVASLPGNCVSRPATSLQSLEEKLGQAHVVTGFFVDWDGITRSLEAPGDGYACQVEARNGHLGVMVLGSQGLVCYEADYHPSLDSLRAAGVTVQLAKNIQPQGTH